MTLDSSELIPGAVIESAHVLQFYNLLTGVMTDQATLLKNKLTLTRVAAASPSPAPHLLVTGVADTGVTGEVQDVYFNFARTVQIAGASIPASNRSFYIAAPTLASSSAQTLAKASTVAISGPPVAGTNLTLTRPLSLELETGDLQITTGNFRLGTTVTWSTGSGTPEGSVTAEPGSNYSRTNGTFWRKSSGSGNTGWSQVGGMTIGATYRGTIVLATVTTNTATITAVVVANSQLRNNGWTSTADGDRNAVYIYLTNTTTITATRDIATNTSTVSYELTEWI